MKNRKLGLLGFSGSRCAASRQKQMAEKTFECVRQQCVVLLGAIMRESKIPEAC